MRELEYGMHCVRKHAAGIIVWISEVFEKIGTVVYKLEEKIEEKSRKGENISTEEEIIATLVKISSELAVGRYNLKLIYEEYCPYKIKSMKINKEEAIRICLKLIGCLRDIRVYLDNNIETLLKLGIEDAVIDEIREAVGNCEAAIYHLIDTIESITLKVEEQATSEQKEQVSSGQAQEVAEVVS